MTGPREKAMAAILGHPQPAALVHSFPEEDLHFLIHDIGLEDAMPLISLASNRQWEFFLDLETWHRDQLDLNQTTKWLQLLLTADPDRLANWCFDEKLEFLELYLFRNIELRVRESEEAPSDMGKGFYSDDDTYYFRPVNFPADTPEKKKFLDRRNAMLVKLLKRLSHMDHPRYQGLLVEAASLLPGEIEEELFRLRSVRLAEKGFLPFDEAIGVYQPMAPEDLAAKGKKVIRPPSTDSALPVPLFAAGILAGDNLFIRALKTIVDPHVIQLLQTEFASLCNQLISADHTIVRSRDQLREVVSKASNYLSVGLEVLTPREKQPETGSTALLQRHLLVDLFRIGFGKAMKLKWKADRWHQKSWFKKKNTGLPFWDEAWLGILGGLLIQTPKYYAPSGAPSKYRNFHTLEELDSTEKTLNQILAMDRLLNTMDPKVESIPTNRLLTYKNLLLTLWAGAVLNPGKSDQVPSFSELPLGTFRNFFDSLWMENQRRRRIGDEKKREFLAWVAKKSGFSSEVLSKELGTVFEELFNEIETELAAVKSGNLDPRYIHLFLLKR
jgi:hypothetical protein